MVSAVPTPGDDPEYQRGLQSQIKKLEEEAKMHYCRMNGLMIWNITESAAAPYPVRSIWDKILFTNKEFKNAGEDPKHYLDRIGKNGISVRKADNLYVSHGKIGLDFEITDLITETIEKEKQELEMTLISLAYQGWSAEIPALEGEAYRAPDVIQFPQSLFRWDDILKEEYRANRNS